MDNLRSSIRSLLLLIMLLRGYGGSTPGGGYLLDDVS